MQAILHIPAVDCIIDSSYSIISVWNIAHSEPIQASSGELEAWLVECNNDIEQPGSDPLVVIRWDIVSARAFSSINNSYACLWNDKIWRVASVDILQWLITGSNPRLMGFKGNSYIDLGYFYSPYLPALINTPILDPASLNPSKGILTRYGKKLLEASTAFYSTIRINK